jgi:hypothetical protein
MATTSLWRVSGWLGKLVVYVENPEKTTNPKSYAKPDMTENEVQGLSDVIDYAVNANKTTAQTNDDNMSMQQFVSGINVSPITARDSMLRTKREFDKTGGVAAYHGYQSFAIGEATPEIAHEIGKRLAEQLWGEKYQVLVATHIDKSNHLHNHFVINTVSHIDGKKFYRSEKDYYDMQKASDTLCREYGLSVIEKSERGKSKHYAEWKADKEKKPTYRSIIKSDVDMAIRQSMTERQLWDNLKNMGYHVKFGKDITLRAEGKDSGLKLKRNFGEDYSIENIRKRILAQSRPEPKQMRTIGTLHKTLRTKDLMRTKKITGLKALYFYYLYRMGGLRSKSKPSPKQVYFLFREDIRFMQSISKETRFLVEHKIETVEHLLSHKNSVSMQIKSLTGDRKKLWGKLRSIKDEEKIVSIKNEISVLSGSIAKFRKEVRLCESIEKRSLKMRSNVTKEREDGKKQRKELKRNEQFR